MTYIINPWKRTDSVVIANKCQLHVTAQKTLNSIRLRPDGYLNSLAGPKVIYFIR